MDKNCHENQYELSCRLHEMSGFSAGSVWSRKDTCSVGMRPPSSPNLKGTVWNAENITQTTKMHISLSVTTVTFKTPKCQLCISLQFIPLGN